jgi:hypothetical protein
VEHQKVVSLRKALALLPDIRLGCKLAFLQTFINYVRKKIIIRFITFGPGVHVIKFSFDF